MNTGRIRGLLDYYFFARYECALIWYEMLRSRKINEETLRMTAQIWYE